MPPPPFFTEIDSEGTERQTEMGAVNSTHPKSDQPWKGGMVVEMSSGGKKDAKKWGEGRLEERELEKEENKTEGIWEVERRRVGETFSLVNKGLHYIRHTVSLCLLSLLFFFPTVLSASSFLPRLILHLSLQISVCLSHQTRFVDLVVRGLENRSRLKQSFMIPACNHTSLQRKF